MQVRGDWVVVGLLNKVIVYNFDTANGLEKPIHTIEDRKLST